MATLSIHVAAKANDLQDILRNLTAATVDVNEKDTLGFTPLHTAVASGSVSATLYLLSYGADHSIRDSTGKGYVYWAAVNNHDRVLRLLIEKGLPVDEADEDGNSALFHAARLGRLEIVRTLCENKANLRWTNKLGQTVMHFAAMYGQLCTLQLLVEDWGQHNCGLREDDNGVTMTHLAAGNNRPETVRYLCNSLHADVNAQDCNGDTPLHWAAMEGAIEAAVVLVALGRANTDPVNEAGQTPLHLCGAFGLLDTAEYLKSKACNLKALDKNGNTALHLAAMNGHWQVFPHLYHDTTDFHSRNQAGHTPLLLAVENGQERTAAEIQDIDPESIKILRRPKDKEIKRNVTNPFANGSDFMCGLGKRSGKNPMRLMREGFLAEIDIAEKVEEERRKKEMLTQQDYDMYANLRAKDGDDGDYSNMRHNHHRRLSTVTRKGRRQSLAEICAKRNKVKPLAADTRFDIDSDEEVTTFDENAFSQEIDRNRKSTLQKARRASCILEEEEYFKHMDVLESKPGSVSVDDFLLRKEKVQNRLESIEGNVTAFGESYESDYVKQIRRRSVCPLSGNPVYLEAAEVVADVESMQRMLVPSSALGKLGDDEPAAVNRAQSAEEIALKLASKYISKRTKTNKKTAEEEQAEKENATRSRRSKNRQKLVDRLQLLGDLLYKNAEGWSVADVLVFLHKCIKLPQYSNEFERSCVDGTIFLNLDFETLSQVLMVDDMEHIEHILEMQEIIEEEQKRGDNEEEKVTA